MSVPVLCRSTTVGVAFSSIAPFQHTACLLKDIYSPGTLHMCMTRSIVPRGIEMSDSDDCFSITAGNLPSLSLSDTSLSDRRSMWTVSDNFLRYGELTITQSSESDISVLVIRMCSVLQLENLAGVQYSVPIL